MMKISYDIAALEKNRLALYWVAAPLEDQPRPAVVRLTPDGVVVTSVYRQGDGRSVPEAVYNGAAQEWPVHPRAHGPSLAAFLQRAEMRELFERVYHGLEIDPMTGRGSLTEDAQDAYNAVRDILDPDQVDHPYRVYACVSTMVEYLRQGCDPAEIEEKGVDRYVEEMMGGVGDDGVFEIDESYALVGDVREAVLEICEECGIPST